MQLELGRELPQQRLSACREVPHCAIDLVVLNAAAAKRGAERSMETRPRLRCRESTLCCLCLHACMQRRWRTPLERTGTVIESGGQGGGTVVV